MQKFERWLAVGLVALVALILALVVIGPQLDRQESPPEPAPTPGNAETMTARVIEVIDEGVIESGFEADFGGAQHYQRLLLEVVSGSLAGQRVIVEEGTMNIVGQERSFRPGDRVYLERLVGPQQERLYITDFVRTNSLFWIVALFVGLVLLIGRTRGARSLAGALFSLVMILGFILPQIKAGHDPVNASVIGSIIGQHAASGLRGRLDAIDYGVFHLPGADLAAAQPRAYRGRDCAHNGRQHRIGPGGADYQLDCQLDGPVGGSARGCNRRARGV